MKYLLVCSAFSLNYSVVIPAHPETTSEIMQELTNMTMTNSIISLDRTTFNKYVNNSKKDYSFLVIFTSSYTQCHRCKITTEEFLLVANSFNRNSPSYNLFFGRVDIAPKSEVPQDVRQFDLYLPCITHYPAKNEEATMDIQKLGAKAENIAKWIQERANIKIRVHRLGKSDTVGIIFFFFFWVSFFILRRENLKFLHSNILCVSGAVIFYLVMTSGHIWNPIKGALYYRATENEMAIVCEFTCQFLFESYIVPVINVGILVGMIIFIKSAREVKKSETAYGVCTVARRYPRRIKYVAGMAAVHVLFSLLMFAFRMKVIL